MSESEQSLFLSTSCNPCLLNPTTVKPGKLSKCLGCKLIHYCSVGHQKLDWRIHRKFCQAVRAILAGHNADHLFAIDGPLKTQEELNVTTLKVKYMLRSILKRKLSFHEEELTSFPVMCAVCYSTKMSKLYQCKKCNAVSYCCEDHEQEYFPIHRTECAQLKLYYCKFKINPDIVRKLILRNKCNLLESNLTTAMKTMFGISFAADPSEKLGEYKKFSVASDFSCIATITYFVKQLDMQQYRGDQFTVYIAGATTDEMWFTPIHVKFFLASFPQILRLNVVFIGPEVTDAIGTPTTYDMGECRFMFRAAYKTKLEDFFSEHRDHLKPNLIVCFNCGFSENTQKNSHEDLWYKAIVYMMEMPEIPLLFTSYTSLEADFDFGALMKVVEEGQDLSNMRLERIIAKQQNPYRDMRPFRTWQFNDPERIFYRNGYVQAVRVKLNDY